MEKEMNVQAHLSGQISGQVQNQLQPQQNGNQQMQNLSAPTTGGVAAAGAHSVNVYNAEPELHRYRWLMQQKIFSIILQKQSQPVGDQQKQRFKEFAKRLEEGLFKAAQTKDDYLNMNTLESRLSSLLKRPPANSQNQRHPQLVNSSSSIGTMIPTPGMSNSGNSNMMTSSVDTMMISSSGCDSIAPIAANTGGLLPSSGMHNGSFGRPDGNLSNGYQQHQHLHLLNNDAFGQSLLISDPSSQVKREPGMEHHNDVLHSQTSDHFQISELQNQFQQIVLGDHSRNAQNPPHPDRQHDMSS
ncbi:hypothetical protein POPTR_019G036800v4 [Populus trichocarpa]|uniref:Uncharacterized protein n=2 Tax=Populus trichocarpa TaxID=3694 RepID=A0ACC0RJT0_POPTR|nr:histone acetyltransferase HAC1 [Populus trichocarpa]KAI9377204.1 hypothetical protein POPTR_019G036800v4 [Populus trichocarpa]